MMSTDTTTRGRRAFALSSLAQARPLSMALPIALLAMMITNSAKMADHHQHCRDDERGAISVEQFAWIGIALFLIVAAAAALKIYWGDVSTFVTGSWNSITGQGGN